MAEEDVNEAGNAEAQEPQAASPGSQKNPLVAILLVFNMAALGAVAFFQYKFMEMEKNRPSQAELLKQSQQKAVNEDVADETKPKEDLKAEQLQSLEEFTVNLAQGDGPRKYVRLQLVLKLSADSNVTEIQERKPQIRDTVISILNAKRPQDLLKRDGKIYLKEQLKSSINSFLIDARVIDIFYIKFQLT